MRQQEQIESAAYQYTDNVMPDICRNMDEDIYSAFKAGVEWADKYPFPEALWHSINEEPKGNWRVLCYSDPQMFTYTKSFFKEDKFKSFKDFAEQAQVIFWAYVEDLIPISKHE